MKGISKYLASTPIRVQVDNPKEKKEKILCDVADCTTFWPHKVEGEDESKRKGKHAFADVIFTNSFGRQIALCCYHYDTGLYKAGKGRMSEVTGEGVNLTWDAVKEHWAKVDARDAELAEQRARNLAAEMMRNMK